ncbi:hypothetical protein C9374_008039 [Naegleria lovaniensis]|uniref:Ribonucleoside-diphosphate reductase n=1 Tax=Naegleria lovaniensis TaxID=51637 RepID=A0AA88GLY7_NAELO|nr:uncharacterized protein C9374_008039 [Naegleria lovaniensis]KAG2378891.1 hypothetical protein C9374_008039 [Naegleria lovaniensis]
MQNIDQTLQTKYLCKDLSDLAKRVSTHVARNEAPSQFKRWQKEFESVMTRLEFMPSGNTLSGSGTDKTLQPNCSVMGEITDENFEQVKSRSKRLWQKAIGIGYSINTSDPVKTLEELSQLNDSITLWENRPKRGNMAVISVDHPQFAQVAAYKASNLSRLYNFNISVAVTDEFMRSLDNEQAWKDTNRTPRELLQMISQHCHACGDPGLVFIDRVQSSNMLLTSDHGRVHAAVPCGEQFLHDNETCNLGVVNLNAPSLYNENSKTIHWKRLKRVVSIAIRFLDNVVDLLEIPDEKMRIISKQLRRIGLGVAGWADLLSKMGYSYDSQDSLELADRVSRTITEQARKTSASLAREKGECKYRRGFRNISLTCIQPTGGISSVLGNQGYCIEPFFAEANELSSEAHIQMQAAWQKNIEQGISKTINMPHSATVQDIYEAYVLAFEKGCKGITVYRNQCREAQPIRCKECEEDVCPKL